MGTQKQLSTQREKIHMNKTAHKLKHLQYECPACYYFLQVSQ